MKRQIKTILRKAEAMRQDAKTAIGSYRLYTYVPWAHIPEQIKPYFPETSEEVWDSEISVEDLDIDIEIQVKGLLNDLAKGNVIRAVMLIPTLIADIFILGHDTKNYERRYKKMMEDYALVYWIDSLVADVDIITKSTQLINDMLNKAEINPGFDIKEFRDSVLTEIIEKRIDQPPTPNRNPMEPLDNNNPELMGSIDKALDEYRARTGVDLVQELDLEQDTDVGEGDDTGAKDKDTEPKHIQ